MLITFKSSGKIEQHLHTCVFSYFSPTSISCFLQSLAYCFEGYLGQLNFVTQKFFQEVFMSTVYWRIFISSLYAGGTTSCKMLG